MKRREFIALTGAAFATWPFSARSQQSDMPVVGWLNGRPLERSKGSLAAFRKGLGEAGFTEGENVKLLLRPGGKGRDLSALAADLVQHKVAAIMAGSPPAALAAKNATGDIPVVFTSGANPVQIGLVSSFNRPGGNVTGFHVQYSEIVGKRLSLLHEMAPKAKRIAVMVNPDHPSDAEPTVRNAREAGEALALDVKVFNVTNVEDVGTAFAGLVDWGAEAVLVGPDPLLAAQRGTILTLATRHALPSSGFSPLYPRGGGLMSYGPDVRDMYRRGGIYIGRILKGEKPAELPVQQPTKFQLVVNLKTAAALGLTISPTTLARADDIIE